MSTTKLCPECGMDQTEWPDNQGFRAKDKTYCCEGCARGTSCTCE